MPQIEWFYAKNDQPCGPVSPVELKQFAERGELHEEDLVWREGMGEWIPAGKVKGLFDSNGEAAADADQAVEEEVDEQQSPPRGEVPAAAIPNAPPAAAELPIRSVPIQDRGFRDVEPATEVKLTLKDIEIEAAPLRHPLDALADLSRHAFHAHFVHSTVVLFRAAGQYGVLLAIVAIGFLAFSLTSKTEAPAIVLPLTALGAVILLLGQYVTRHVLSAADRLDLTAQAALTATGPLDALAAVVMLLGLGSLLQLAAYAMATSTAWPAFVAIAVFIVCQFTAIVAWNPRAVGLNVVTSATPGREAAAQICFLGKLVWRLSVVAYGTGIVLGAIATLNVAVHIGLPDEPDPRWFSTELFVPLIVLLVALPLPALGYVIFLACQYLAEVMAKPMNWGRRR